MERVKRFLCALLVAITMVTMVSAPLQVQAATASGNSDWKKAPTIRKRGTYTVTDKKKDRTSNLYSRYVKIHLKKGQAIYIKGFWTGGKHQYTMKIKC